MPDRFHLLRLDQRLARFVQCLLRVQAFGDVAGDLGKAENRSIRTADGIDDDIGPEFRAVLADTPAFLLVTADPDCGLQRFLR
jgi:hypothetical protein